MDEGLKQRLIGAFVLLALGVIFIPVLFEPDPSLSVSRETLIPEAPAVEAVRIEPPKPVADLEAAKPPEEMYQMSVDNGAHQVAAEPESVGDDKPSQKAPILDDKGVVKAWAVQVGSFKEAERAAVLTASLLERGYDAFSRGSADMTRVYVGPKADRAAVIALKKSLDQDLGSNTLIVSFTP